MSHRSRESPLTTLVLASVWLMPLAAAAQAGWTADPEVQRRLAQREIVVQSAAAVDPEHPRGRVRAAVLIGAAPEAVWAVMTDCRQTTLFVPGLRRCRRIDGAADGRWEDFEQEIHYSWFLPSVRYVIRADYDRPRRIDFHRISGDLKQEEGTWLLSATPDGAATVVEYEMYLDPGFWIPQALVNRSLRKDLPAALAGLRERVERPR
ncbi:MAG TPA: SRPBCC family protein [Steroidobacteraceae bacterium]|nr:SRPBCC family protein [Steroidobacteraceae bacterium]